MCRGRAEAAGTVRMLPGGVQCHQRPHRYLPTAAYSFADTETAGLGELGSRMNVESVRSKPADCTQSSLTGPLDRHCWSCTFYSA